MPELFIDGMRYEYRNEDANLLATCLSHGLDLPYFCWHPALNSVGACRQCAVKVFKDESDATGRLVMSCMTALRPGMRVSIEDPVAREFRAGVIEWLMVNHPHDCPVCDEGGECHLQDMTVMTGHSYRRYRHPKRTHLNQNLGPFLNHEMNRCIQCYRCVRFYRDYAGGSDLDVFGWHDHVYFGRYEDGRLESEFSGNLVEICPTGVFTDKTLKQHYTRKWDLQTAPSVCTQCGLGCNTIAGEREGALRRVYARYSSDINGYFLCDRGRFGYEYSNGPHRIRLPQVGGSRTAGVDSQPEKAEDAELETAALKAAETLMRGKRVIGIGSPRASIESNFALRRLVGEENFFHGVGESELKLVRKSRAILEMGIGRSVQEAGRSDGVLVIGEDLHNSAPILALSIMQAARVKARSTARSETVGGIHSWDDSAIREAMQNKHGPFYVAAPVPTKLDRFADAVVRQAPRELVDFVAAVSHEVDKKAPARSALSKDALLQAKEIASALSSCERPVVVCGMSCRSEELLEAAANLTVALRTSGTNAGIVLVVPEANTLSQAFFGERGLDSVLAMTRSGDADTAIVLENDIERRVPADDFTMLASKLKLVALEHTETATTRVAEVVLPVATVYEGDGSYLNNEGRLQRAVQVYYPAGPTRESWKWLGALEATIGKSRTNPWLILDNVQSAVAGDEPALAGIREVIPPVETEGAQLRIPRLAHRASGRTALNAARTIHEPPPPHDDDSAMAFSMEGRLGLPPAGLTPRYWTPGWNSVQALNKFQTEVAGLLKGGESSCLVYGVKAPRSRNVTAAGDGNGAPSLTYFSWESASRESSDPELLEAIHLFGSEETSMGSEKIANLAPEPYVGISEEDAGRLGLSNGERASVTVGRQTIISNVKVIEGLAHGVILYPRGLPRAEYLDLPSTCRIAKASAGEGGGA